MAKKILSYLLILLVTAAAAWGIFGGYIIQVLNPDTVSRRQSLGAVCLDSRGNIYCLQNTGGRILLIGVDDTGQRFLEKTLFEEDEQERLVMDLYAAETGSLLVASAAVDPLTERISSIAMDAFYANGTHAGRLFELFCDQSAEQALTGGVRFSSVSEADGEILFGVFARGADGRQVIELYTAAEGAFETARKVGEYPDIGYTGFLALDSSTAIAAAPGRLALLSGDSAREITIDDGLLPGRFWRQGDGGAVFLDMASGDLYLADPVKMTAYPCARGETVVYEESGLRLRQFDLVSVNPSLRIAGVVRTPMGGEFYTGGGSYMDYTGSTGQRGFNLQIFWVAAIALGVLLVATFLWDVYVDFLKMRVSIVFKQTITIVLSMAAMTGLLIQLVFSQSLEQMLTWQYRERLLAAAQTAEAGIRAGQGQTLWDELEKGSVLHEGNGSAEVPLRYDLLREMNGSWRVELSSTHGMEGVLLQYLPLRDKQAAIAAGVPEVAALAEGGVVYVDTYEQLGQRFYLFARLPEGRLLSVSSSAVGMQRTIDMFLRDIALVLSVGGAVMLLVLLVVQWFVVRGLRRLKRGVDAVSAGNYAVHTEIFSGDEVEDLSRAFNTMTGVIRRQVASLAGVNKTVLRFVPENLLRLIGAQSLEQIDKTAFVKADMTTLLVRFIFPDGTPQTADALFSAINRVIERIAPLVSANGGTVYDFRHDGFHAVFSGEPADAVRCAIQIREAGSALNAADDCRVDIRAAIVSGEVLLGIIGDEQRMSPTAVSDAMDTARRMMDLCWDSSLYIICTGQVFERIEGYRSRFVGLADLGGRRERLFDLYEGDPYSLLKHKQSYSEVYRRAVDAFYQQRYEPARALFMQILQASLEDGVSRNYMYWADRYCTQGCSDPVYRIFEG